MQERRRTAEDQEVLTAVPCHSTNVIRDSWVPNAEQVYRKIGDRVDRAGGESRRDPGT